MAGEGQYGERYENPHIGPLMQYQPPYRPEGRYEGSHISPPFCAQKR